MLYPFKNLVRTKIEYLRDERTQILSQAHRATESEMKIFQGQISGLNMAIEALEEAMKEFGGE